MNSPNRNAWNRHSNQQGYQTPLNTVLPNHDAWEEYGILQVYQPPLNTGTSWPSQAYYQEQGANSASQYPSQPDASATSGSALPIVWDRNMANDPNVPIERGPMSNQYANDPGFYSVPVYSPGGPDRSSNIPMSNQHPGDLTVPDPPAVENPPVKYPCKGVSPDIIWEYFLRSDMFSVDRKHLNPPSFKLIDVIDLYLFTRLCSSLKLTVMNPPSDIKVYEHIANIMNSPWLERNTSIFPQRPHLSQPYTTTNFYNYTMVELIFESFQNTSNPHREMPVMAAITWFDGIDENDRFTYLLEPLYNAINQYYNERETPELIALRDIVWEANEYSFTRSETSNAVVEPPAPEPNPPTQPPESSHRSSHGTPRGSSSSQDRTGYIEEEREERCHFRKHR
ncbi:hypothetical protein SBOR_5100 [Sclerotinia borealis F-4128]|uniref:Uncharacterized protein n=1 Tax=Sclerotinia borealis (strain F-4128) TaxID=1432307 RepID=W9CJ10_SCLBF|nr:hypothetical protein SBOR_5100 [Sclerotinia borealis F-4128]